MSYAKAVNAFKGFIVIIMISRMVAGNGMEEKKKKTVPVPLVEITSSYREWCKGRCPYCSFGLLDRQGKCIVPCPKSREVKKSGTGDNSINS